MTPEHHMKIKLYEPIVVLVFIGASLMFPYLPLLSKMLPGYFVLVAAFLGCLESATSACISTGFCLSVASIVLALIHRWGTAAVLSILAFFSFGLIVGFELFYYNIAIGYGLAFLLAALLIHSFFSMKWYLQSRPNRNFVSSADSVVQ